MTATNDEEVLLTFDGLVRDFDENNRDQFGHFRTVEDYDRWYQALPPRIKKRTPYYGKEYIPRLPVRRNGADRTRQHSNIMSYVGVNGGGKTLAMVHDAIRTLNGQTFDCRAQDHHHPYYPYRGERRVLSSVRIFDPRTGQDHPRYIPLYDYRQIVIASHCDILLDEITGLASQDENSSIPVQVKNVFAQQRRRQNRLAWTTPNWATASKSIRNVTRTVTHCSSTWFTVEPGQTWGSNGHFTFKTYDATSFEYFNVEKMSRLVTQNFCWYWRTSKNNVAADIYDTSAGVLTMGATNDAGMCLKCGGMRRTRACDPKKCGSGYDMDELIEALMDEFGLNLSRARDSSAARPEAGAEDESAEDAPVQIPTVSMGDDHEHIDDPLAGIRAHFDLSPLNNDIGHQ